MTMVKIIKIYAGNKENKVATGEIKNGEDYMETYRRILKENRTKNVGRFITVHYIETGAYITEYYDGIKRGKGTIIWLQNETLKEICKDINGADAE